MVRSFLLSVLISSLFATVHAQVRVTEKQLVIPSYEVKEAEPNPYFFKCIVTRELRG